MTRVPPPRRAGWRGAAALLFVLLLNLSLLHGGISKDLQNYYVENYKNRALYLKIPVHGFRQVVNVGTQPDLDRSTIGQPLAFRVGEQVRILDLNFKDDFIRFKIAAVDLSRESEIVFQFSSPLNNEFSQGRFFDAALDYTFTAGVDYKEIDAAKESFITDQFDQLIDQFAKTTSTSRQYVIQTISEKNPEFEKNKRLLVQREKELAAARQQLEAEVASKRASERDVGAIRQQLASAESAADSLKMERAELLDQRDTLQERLQKLESDSQAWQKQRSEYESRMNQLSSSLDLESNSNTDLTRRITGLDQAIQQLKQENVKASQELADLKKQHQEQSEALKKSESERSKLAADLRALTSDKNGLNNRFLQSRKRGEALETALQLASGLTVTRQAPGSGQPDVTEVFLLGRKLGSLQVDPPSSEPFKVRFEMVSPDTVEFSEDERKLWGALGGESNIRAEWSGPEDSRPSLVNSEPQQRVAPREVAEWTFQLPTAPARPTPLRLQVTLFDPDGREVPLAGLDFEAKPTGLAGFVNGGFSWLSGLVGLLLGAGAVFLLRRSGARSKSRPPTPSEAQAKRM